MKRRVASGVPVMNLPTASIQTTVHAQPPGETDTRLRGRWLLLARVVWVGIALLTLGLSVASIPTSFASLHILCTDAPAICSDRGTSPQTICERFRRWVSPS